MIVQYFRLLPNPDHLDHPLWQCSAHKGECAVAAVSEKNARELAARKWVDLARVERNRLPTPSPWLDPDLVTVNEAIDFARASLPYGTVLIPDTMPEHETPRAQ